VSLGITPFDGVHICSGVWRNQTATAHQKPITKEDSPRARTLVTRVFLPADYAAAPDEQHGNSDNGADASYVTFRTTYAGTRLIPSRRSSALFSTNTPIVKLDEQLIFGSGGTVYSSFRGLSLMKLIGRRR
jgi:hypothetical protein